MLIAKELSYPHFLYIPDSWFDTIIRIMIAGEEGSGTKDYRYTIKSSEVYQRTSYQSVA